MDFLLVCFSPTYGYLYIYIHRKGTSPGPTKFMSRNLCYTRHKVNDLSLFFLWRYLFYLVFFWFRVRSFGEEGGANIYIYMYVYGEEGGE